jgi:molybdopterin molybdotransferase
MSERASMVPPADCRSPSPAQTVLRFADQVAPVALETVDWAMACGRVLAQDIRADRDHPAIDVSAMDGYAVRMADVRPGVLPMRGAARIGQPPVAQPEGAAVPIVTGAPVPLGADVVLRREDVAEQADAIVLPSNLISEVGQNIRRQGENTLAGSVILQPGIEISSAIVGVCTAFGLAKLAVFRQVRVSVIVTGTELLHVADHPHPWQIRDTNGPAVAAMLADLPWVQCLGIHAVRDDLQATVVALEKAVSVADVVLMTGGVSMGDRDFAQVAVAKIGARTVFHGLPIRPGKPMLGAVAPGGQAILGLPGNPVSVLVTARRFALIALRRLAGLAVADLPQASVLIDQPDLCNPKLWLYPPVRLTGSGRARVIATKGSGDAVSAAQSDGFVEIAPDSPGQAQRAYFPWRP